ncbi:hypothetical protein HWV07_15405 [Natronomonas salina]|uniref:hypothetical protein n=1 Tax=Natronomonas salina TaxID=1710540 RepID=UPI0015B4D41B|nr:hypothetical protein [Natronomonas salina]QLD90347.1 hypothetical protein HWV07_15405 [Natronomonas salina]
MAGFLDDTKQGRTKFKPCNRDLWGQSNRDGPMISDWPLILGGILVSILLVPLVTYHQLVVSPIVKSGESFLLIGLIALLPGFLMGGIGLWVAARG